jgi:hypothetical protein
MIRFEILLPLYFNDGRPVERERLLETDDEIVRLFGAASTDTVRWLYVEDGSIKAPFTKTS